MKAREDTNNTREVKAKRSPLLEKEVSVVPKKHKRKISLVSYILLFVISLAICLLFASKTVERRRLTPINYTQKGNVDYKVYLNKNEFYTEKYLDMNKAYIASLINYIDVNFNYDFNITWKTDIVFDYRIVGELVIENSNGSSRYLEKEYTLLESKKKKLVEDNKINILENIKIDYAYYNQLANSFKSTYGVDINSYLNVYLEVKPQTDENSDYEINEINKVSLRIPLSEKAIEIHLDAGNQSVVKQIMAKGKVIFSLKYLILEILLFLPACVLLVLIIKRILILTNRYTLYDRFIRKILKQYDRLIVETNSPLKTRGYNTIEVKNFIELLDAHDNLKLPIIYLNTKEHEEGIFYIINNNDIYMFNVNNELLNNM